MTKLNDTQCILLSTAAQREDGSLYPLADAQQAGGARITKAIAFMLAKGLVEERECTATAAVHRTGGDLSFGVFATEAGLAAIGLGEDGPKVLAEPASTLPSPVPSVRVIKASILVALLERPEGATLAEMIAATGWLPHTTRAALTGLRKKGHALERSKRGDDSCYAIAAAQ